MAVFAPKKAIKIGGEGAASGTKTATKKAGKGGKGSKGSKGGSNKPGGPNVRLDGKPRLGRSSGKRS